MSSISELLNNLCPAGVPFRRLHEVSKLTAGDRVTKTQMSDLGMYPAYGGGTTPTGWYNEFNRENAVTIARAGSAGFVNFVPGKFWATDVCFVADQLEDGPEIKFVFYWLKSREYELMTKTYGGSMPKIDKRYLWDHPVPVPPLEVQREIVRILDTFTGLEAELQAELAARQNQVDYYRSKLLGFAEKQITWVELGSLASVKMCKRVFANQTSSTGDVPFFKIGTFGKTPDSFISRKLFDEYKNKFSFPHTGAVLISASGTIGRTVVFDGQDAYFQDSNIVWLDHDGTLISDNFLKHWFGMVDWVTEGGTIQRLYNKHLLAATFPLIPLSEQIEIADILDKFNEFRVESLSSLAAEIETRHKQYEHYRNQLLTFKELVA
jgi:type I restriction enzyme S subunit